MEVGGTREVAGPACLWAGAHRGTGLLCARHCSRRFAYMNMGLSYEACLHLNTCGGRMWEKIFLESWFGWKEWEAEGHRSGDPSPSRTGIGVQRGLGRTTEVGSGRQRVALPER